MQCGWILVVLLITEMYCCLWRCCSSTYVKWLIPALCSVTWLGTLRWQVQSQTLLQIRGPCHAKLLMYLVKPLGFPWGKAVLTESNILLSQKLGAAVSHQCISGCHVPGPCSLPCCMPLSSLHVCQLCHLCH